MKKIIFRVVLALIILVALYESYRVVPQIWRAYHAQPPETLGVVNGQLTPCPPTPNCVSTDATLDTQKMASLPYHGTLAESKAQLLKVVQAMPRNQLLANQDNYLAFLFRTQWIGYPDDVEFYFDDAAKVIHFRSAARLGRGDRGFNRARMTAISDAYNAATATAPTVTLAYHQAQITLP